MNNILELNPNKLVKFLNKPKEDFTKDDIIKNIASYTKQAFKILDKRG